MALRCTRRTLKSASIHIDAPIRVRAIPPDLFLSSFQNAWAESRTASWPGTKRSSFPRRVGLAVSGGADSMALAYLCRKVESSRLLLRDGLAITAFVVDHKAREESSREARTVAKWLWDMGIECHVLELQWPQGAMGTSGVSAFETHARQLRYQALGKACRDHNIETLLLGHHQDDNVETTLWRLSSGARGSGLAGIPHVARIPECHGLPGVAGSRSSFTLVTRRATGTAPLIKDEGNSEMHLDLPLQLLPSLSIHISGDSTQIDNATSDKDAKSEFVATISTGGILICRPLLPFSKASLLTTCLENHIPYVSDPTNRDPTLTPRNAIRSLISSGRLPRALEPPSILSLIRSSRHRLQDSKRLSDLLLQRCRIISINLRAGVLAVQFPTDEPTPESTIQPTVQQRRASKNPAERACQIQDLTLRRITDLLSPFPDNHFPLRSFESFTHRVFRSTLSASSRSNDAARKHSNNANSTREAFTVGGVMIQPVKTKHQPESELQSHPSPKCTVLPNNKKKKLYSEPEPPPDSYYSLVENVWLLSRQPFIRHRLPFAHVDVPITPAVTLLGHKPGGVLSDDNSKLIWSPWTLWDNRYWLRFAAIRNPAESERAAESLTHNPNTDRSNILQEAEEEEPSSPVKNTTLFLTIRPLQKPDLQTLRQHLADDSKSHLWARFRTELSHQAPGQIRFTIPLVSVSRRAEDDGSAGVELERLVALPTLQPSELPPSLCGEFTFMSTSWKVIWEWRYKLIDPEVLKLMTGCFPNSENEVV